MAATAAFGFVLFGISDLIEIGTGAWWRPGWLLLAKIACLSLLVACLLAYLRDRSES
jgi:hypothetical protein